MSTALSDGPVPPLRSPAPAPAPVPARAVRRGRVELIAVAVLLAVSAGLYLWNLSANGWANSYYAAAVQAMSQDWKAFFFGSLDTGNVITVDKPPASLWVMALSARIFGFSSWSILVPQALMGVGSVGLLYAAVRRVAGPAAGLVAGAVLAVTPVAALMFRYDNPDALLVLLMLAAAYATVRAIEKAGTRWLLVAGACIGLAFLTKMAQAFLVLPGLGLAYLIAAPTGLGRRIRQLSGALAAVVVSAGWWFAIVELWPTDSRPYIGGSDGDSALELALGYNGLGRIFGGDGNPGGSGNSMPEMTEAGMAGPSSGGFGDAGWLRMFSEAVGAQVSWLLPAALALLLIGFWLTRRSPRTDPGRASLIIWGGWTVVTGGVFSVMSGIFHEYYTIALAPGVAALIGLGGQQLRRHRGGWAARTALAALTAGTAGWAYVLLSRAPDYLPWLKWLIVVAGMTAAGVLLLGAVGKRAMVVAALALAVTGLAGPTAYTLNTVNTAYSGGVIQAGPQSSDERGMSAFGEDLGDTDPELVTLLQSAGTKWSAAITGASSHARLQLDSGTSVIDIGGFSGGDPAPTLAEFQAMVNAGEVRYYITGGDGSRPGGPGGGSADVEAEEIENPGQPAFPGGDGGSGSEIADWVAANFTSTTVGGRTVYDLTAPTD